MSADGFGMNRYTLRFADASAEAAFLDEQALKSVRPVRIALACLCALAMSFYVLTVHLFGGFLFGIGAQDVLRYSATTLLVFGAGYAITYHPTFLRRHQLVMLVFTCIFVLGITRMAGRYPPDVLEARGYTPMVMFTFLIYSVFRLRFPQAVLASLLGAAFFIGYLYGRELMSATAAGRSVLALGVANCAGMLICYQMDQSARKEFAAMRLLDGERARSERLLLNILPQPIAEQLKASREPIAAHSEAVTVLFADIVGFTRLAARKTPQAVVELLNRIFSEFDALADAHGLEKIKTIGDAYMAVAGLPEPRADHAVQAARMALEMHRVMGRISAQLGEELALRIGLHSGPVVAGVIGLRKFSYDLWGDTVNTASRMESHGMPGTTHCSEATAALLDGAFGLHPRGVIQVKGKGDMPTYLLGERTQPGPPKLAATQTIG